MRVRTYIEPASDQPAINIYINFKYFSRFFDHIAHETTYAYSENKHIMSLSDLPQFSTTSVNPVHK
jgi:hypothetical protein